MSTSNAVVEEASKSMDRGGANSKRQTLSVFDRLSTGQLMKDLSLLWVCKATWILLGLLVQTIWKI